MANWFSSFNEAPASKALETAPSLIARGKLLWDRIARRSSVPVDAAAPGMAPPEAAVEPLAALEVRYGALDKRIKGLEEEMTASFEVVQSLAQQHSALALGMDNLLARTRALLRICIALGVLILCLLVLVFSR